MKKGMRMIVCAFAAAGILIGCSKAPEKAVVTVTGPEGMVLSVNDQKVGAAPVTFKLNGGTYLFKYHAPGYERKWETVKLQAGEQRKIPVELTRESASVLIATKPLGAQLVVDGRVLGSTPIVLNKVVPGREYSGQLRMPGYAERAVQWSVDSARPKRVMIDLDANMVKVEFLSRPAGARLHLNGREVGTTPYRGELTEGKYKLRFELAGYSPLEQTVTLSRGENFKMEYPLAPLPGGISISSVPEGAAVYINGKKRGVTPCVLTDLPAAVYEVRAEKDGYDPVTRKAEITSGYKDEIKLVLLSSTGELELDIRPAGVAVLLDGKELGKTEENPESNMITKPIRVSGLAPGEHIVTVSHPRARPQVRTVKVMVEKGKLTRPKTITVWIANCEIKYRDGRIEVGTLFQEDDNSILFGPEPGIRYEVSRGDLEYVKRLTVE